MCSSPSTGWRRFQVRILLLAIVVNSLCPLPISDAYFSSYVIQRGSHGNINEFVLLISTGRPPLAIEYMCMHNGPI